MVQIWFRYGQQPHRRAPNSSTQRPQRPLVDRPFRCDVQPVSRLSPARIRMEQQLQQLLPTWEQWRADGSPKAASDMTWEQHLQQRQQWKRQQAEAAAEAAATVSGWQRSPLSDPMDGVAPQVRAGQMLKKCLVQSALQHSVVRGVGSAGLDMSWGFVLCGPYPKESVQLAEMTPTAHFE